MKREEEEEETPLSVTCVLSQSPWTNTNRQRGSVNKQAPAMRPKRNLSTRSNTSSFLGIKLEDER